jgi:hypothetical protein
MIPGIVDSAVSATRAFTDEFSGTGSLAQRWTSTRGSWSVVSDKSYTATAASSYPIATFNSNTKAVNVRVDYGTADTHGWGVAFWVKDADNWWAVVTDRTFGYVCNSVNDTLTGSSCKQPDTITQGSGLSCVYSCPAGLTLSGTNCYGPGCPNGGSLGTGNCEDPSYPCYISSSGSFGDTCEVGGIVNYGSASVDCTTYYYDIVNPGATYAATLQYTYKIRLIKSVAGVVTEVDTKNIETSTISTSTIGYVQASISKAGVITATAQMNGGATVQTLTNTPSSPVTAIRHGFILAPSTTGTQATGMERFIYSPV